MTSLERKLRSAEDQLAARPDVVVADDHVFAENRKLMSLVDKYNAELNEAHREIRELKSRLVDSADAKVRGHGRPHKGKWGQLTPLKRMKD